VRALLALILAGATLSAAELFVAPGGDDANDGSLTKPVASLMKAQSLANPGDTVWIRGGTYKAPADKFARRYRIWVYVNLFDKSGTESAPITYAAYKDEKPVFDFSEVRPADIRINAFQVMGSWLRFKGFEVIGTQVNFKRHGQSCNIENHGSHNVFERLSLHDSQAIGIYALDGSHNLFLNCDAYRNHDYTSEDGKGGNVDGFGCHPRDGAVDNVFRGCRAWFNSDDGYDCISSHESVVFDGCWAMYNGYSPKFKSLGDGNGFKAGGYGAATGDLLPAKAPRHVVRGCLAVRNKANGFYANHHLVGGDWFGNSSFGNASDFNFRMRTEDNAREIPGFGHAFAGNLGFHSRHTISELDLDKNLPSSDAFYFAKSTSEFLSLDEAQLTAPRQADGSLPKLTFLVPKDPEVRKKFGATRQ
jgi:hypothetical protein